MGKTLVVKRLRIGLIVSNAREQSFDEIVIMMGCKASVAKEFKVFNLKSASNSLFWTRFKSCCTRSDQKCQRNDKILSMLRMKYAI